MKIFLLTCMIIGLGAATALADAWYLAGRHGGCTALSEAAKRKPIFTGIETPDQFTARLEENNIAFEKKVQDVGGINLISFKVPAENLSIMMVPLAICER